MKNKLPEMVPAKNLKLADVIRTRVAAPWNYATVKQIKDGYLTLFRPYVHTENFSYTGGVICYTGIEEFQIKQDETEYELLESTELR